MGVVDSTKNKEALQGHEQIAKLQLTTLTQVLLIDMTDLSMSKVIQYFHM